MAQYWIVDSHAETVEVWDFASDVGPETHKDSLPVRLAGIDAGTIDLHRIFEPER